MGFMNINFGLISYEDQSPTNPQIRNLDQTRNFQSIPVSYERTENTGVIRPGETKTIVTTARALQHAAATTYNWFRPISIDNTCRLQWSGTGPAPLFRTNRAIGVDNTTQITISRINPAVARVASTAGTTMDTSNVVVGDYLKFEKTNDIFTSVFSEINQDKMFQIVSKGTGYVDILDNSSVALDDVVLGADYDKQLIIMSDGPVLIGDTVEISSANPVNSGTYQIIGVAPTYIDVIAPQGIPEIITGIQVNIYDRLIGFLYIRSHGDLKIKINGQSSSFSLSRLGQYEGIYMGSIKAYRVDIFNESSQPVSATIFHATVE